MLIYFVFSDLVPVVNLQCEKDTKHYDQEIERMSEPVLGSDVVCKAAQHKASISQGVIACLPRMAAYRSRPTVTEPVFFVPNREVVSDSLRQDPN